MSIKAKAVDKKKVAAFDRGQFGVLSSGGLAHLPKRSYYYDGARRYTEVDRARSDSSSSSSVNSPRSHDTGAPGRSAAFPLDHHNTEKDEDMSDDDDVVRRARAATKALLGGPASSRTGASSSTSRKGGELAAPHNERLERYMRAKASSSLSTKPSVLSTPVPVLDPPAAMAWDTSTRAKEESVQSQSGRHHDDHHFAASPTASHVSDTTNEDVMESVTPPSAVDGAFVWHTTNSEFHDLMALLEQDVRREQRDDLPRDAACVASASSERTRLTRQPSAAFMGSTFRPYVMPSCTFAALEDKALEQLYEDWCLQRGEGDGVERGAGHSPGDSDDGPSEVFIAADHRPAAFTIAASAAHQSASASLQRESASMGGVSASVSPQQFPDAPFTWEELLKGEVARRNIRRTPAYGPESSTMLSDPDALAEQATRRLQRFLQSVECVERLVCNKRFMHSVAVFLYKHHKVFLPHHRYTATASQAPETATPEDGGADFPVDTVDNVDVVHTHAEHQVYAEFGERVSAALLSVLTHHVAGFDETEFVETLYDTPVTDVVEESTGFASGDRTALGGPQSVLSFPAWRLLLAISGFDSFFLWMMDYIQEEYCLDGKSDGEAQPIAVAGVRGLRALIRSTYNRPVAASRADTSAVDAQLSAVPPTDTMQREVLLHPPNLPPSDDLSASLEPRPSSDPQNPFARQSPPPPNVFHTPSPPGVTALPMHTSLLSTSLSTDAPLQKQFPTPPPSADGTIRGLIRNSAPPYRKRVTTHPGRDLPPITPNADSMMISTSGDTAATIGQSSSSRGGWASSLSLESKERDLEQPPVVQSANISAISHRTLASPACSAASKNSTKDTVRITDASAGPRGVRAHSKSRTISTTRSQVGIAEKPKPQKPHLKR
ncbi:hypothetical protein JKF63_02391 [Porcisia hertigi]|uniref:Uncharacterized protein n=1 Tax=Porcisia hertigi TaxID=2761500 RepID=A0A836IJP8_9TRYP|nr:hypothetical protein JKF63_02391 [Porcisia hertigi]